MIQSLDQGLVAELIEKAKASSRLRTNFNYHQSNEENPHRFLNVMVEGSYFTPHRHLNPPKSESFLVLQGCVGFVTFSDTGEVESTYRLHEDALADPSQGIRAIDITPGIWHCLVVLSPVAVCYEVKPGPWDPASDKEFAPWAPHEGREGTEEYTKFLVSLFQK